MNYPREEVRRITDALFACSKLGAIDELWNEWGETVIAWRRSKNPEERVAAIHVTNAAQAQRNHLRRHGDAN